MAHYAVLDENNVVLNVFVGVDENQLIEGKNPEQWYSDFYQKKCLRTSYNAYMGIRVDPETNMWTNQPGFRKNYAGIGFTYDEELDAFIPPKPYPSWTLHPTRFRWVAPVPEPGNPDEADEDEFGLISYYWDEENQKWIKR